MACAMQKSQLDMNIVNVWRQGEVLLLYLWKQHEIPAVSTRLSQGEQQVLEQNIGLA